MEGNCKACGGLIMDPNKPYVYAGKVCYCGWYAHTQCLNAGRSCLCDGTCKGLKKTPDWLNPIAAMADAQKVCDLTDQLTAANKAIVALSETLEKIGQDKVGIYYETIEEFTKEILTTHADAIKRARGE